MQARIASVTLAVSLVLGAFSGPLGAAEKPEATLGISSWIGFAPLFVAEEKGFFDEQGVNVTLRRIERVADRRSALAAGQIDGFPTTVDTWVTTAAAGVEAVQVLALDDSYGADGVVAKNEIQAFADLKGKNVGLETGGGASYFWFLYLLNEHDMTLDDIQVQNLSAGAAGSAFAAGRLDAAVTWEPWLTNANKTDFGHVLTTSRETPGVIADTLGLSQDFVQSQPDAAQALVNAWFDALDYIGSDREDAFAIMAKAMNQTPEEFTAAAEGVRWYDRDRNREYMGTADDPGPLYELMDTAAKIYKEYGVIDSAPETQDLANARFVRSE